MACPTCGHATQDVEQEHQWCPRCGTLEKRHVVAVPKLVERCRVFEKRIRGDQANQPLTAWQQLGIAEAIRPEGER